MPAAALGTAVAAAVVEGIAGQTIEYAIKQGWFGQLRSVFKRKHRILVLGETGTGKTMLIQSLTEAMPQVIHHLNRTQVVQKHHIRIAESLFEFIDTPGQAGHRPRRTQALRDTVRNRISGVINVVSYGYHEYSIGSNTALTRLGQPRKTFLRRHRDAEITALGEWMGIVAGMRTAKWLITVVTKADLWWPDRDDVLAHYASGAYCTALGDAAALHPLVVEYCSVIHKFYGRHAPPSTLDEVERTLLRGNLFQAILSAVGQRN